MAREPFLINPPKGFLRTRKNPSMWTKGEYTKPFGALRKRKYDVKPLKGNPFGEELIIVGNPKKERKRRLTNMSRRSGNPWFDDRGGHQRAARLGWGTRRRHVRGMVPKKRKRRAAVVSSGYPMTRIPLRKRRRLAANPKRARRAAAPRIIFLDNPKRRRGGVTMRRRKRSYLMDNRKRRRVSKRRRSYMMDNPRRRRRSVRKRSYARNPFGMDSLSGVDLRRPQTLLMPIAIGILANMAIKRAPALLNVTSPWAILATKVGVLAIGGLFGGKIMGNAGATVWTIVGSVTIATDLINTVVPGILGDMGAYPEEVRFRGIADPGMGAFPYERGMRGLGEGMSDMSGAYPYGSQELSYY